MSLVKYRVLAGAVIKIGDIFEIDCTRRKGGKSSI